MAVVRRSALAEQDYRVIWRYIAADNPGAADRSSFGYRGKLGLMHCTGRPSGVHYRLATKSRLIPAEMNKYEAAKTLKVTRARLPGTCDICGTGIEKGAEYFRESLGPMAKPPGLRLKSLCTACGRAKVAREA